MNKIMRDKQQRVEDRGKINCICSDKHGEVLESCQNRLQDASICQDCVLNCHAGQVLNYAVKNGFADEDQFENRLQLKSYVDKCDSMDISDYERRDEI